MNYISATRLDANRFAAVFGESRAASVPAAARGLRIRKHELHALFRIRKVEGKICSACLDDSEQRHHQLCRTFHVHANQRVPTDAEGAQVVRESVRAPVEFGIR